MPNCYQCGRRFPAQILLRRKVKTGEYLKSAYTTKKVQTMHVRYGMRVVCASCALTIDMEYRQSELRQVIASGLMLLGLIILYLWQTYWK